MMNQQLHERIAQLEQENANLAQQVEELTVKLRRPNNSGVMLGDEPLTEKEIQHRKYLRKKARLAGLPDPFPTTRRKKQK
jgi:hypothetical protein